MVAKKQSVKLRATGQGLSKLLLSLLLPTRGLLWAAVQWLGMQTSTALPQYNILMSKMVRLSTQSDGSPALRLCCSACFTRSSRLGRSNVLFIRRSELHGVWLRTCITSLRPLLPFICQRWLCIVLTGVLCVSPDIARINMTAAAAANLWLLHCHVIRLSNCRQNSCFTRTKCLCQRPCWQLLLALLLPGIYIRLGVVLSWWVLCCRPTGWKGRSTCRPSKGGCDGLTGTSLYWLMTP